MTKKKWVTKGLFLWLVVLLVCLTGMTASAASYPVTKMKYNKGNKIYGSAFRPGKQNYVYSKIVLPSDGTLAISGIRTSTSGKKGNVDMVLCTAHKNPVDVSAHSYVRYDKSKLVYQTYGVTKGTYYIRTRTAKYPKQKFQVFAWYKSKAGRNGGDTQEKAQVLTRNKAKTGVIGCASFYQSKWFKFTVGEEKKAVNLRVLFKGGQGQADIYLYGPGYKEPKKYQIKPTWKKSVSLTIKLGKTVMDPQYPNDKKKAKVTGPTKGDYYILITKDSKDTRNRFSSGGFSVKWW